MRLSSSVASKLRISRCGLTITRSPAACALRTSAPRSRKPKWRSGFAKTGSSRPRCSGSQVWIETQVTPREARRRKDASPASERPSLIHHDTPRRKPGASAAPAEGASAGASGRTACPARRSISAAAQADAVLTSAEDATRAACRSGPRAASPPAAARAWAASKAARGSRWASVSASTGSASARLASGSVPSSHAPRGASSPDRLSSRRRAAGTKSGSSRYASSRATSRPSAKPHDRAPAPPLRRPGRRLVDAAEIDGEPSRPSPAAGVPPGQQDEEPREPPARALAVDASTRRRAPAKDDTLPPNVLRVRSGNACAHDALLPREPRGGRTAAPADRGPSAAVPGRPAHRARPLPRLRLGFEGARRALPARGGAPRPRPREQERHLRQQRARRRVPAPRGRHPPLRAGRVPGGAAGDRRGGRAGPRALHGVALRHEAPPAVRGRGERAPGAPPRPAGDLGVPAHREPAERGARRLRGPRARAAPATAGGPDGPLQDRDRGRRGGGAEPALPREGPRARGGEVALPRPLPERAPRGAREAGPRSRGGRGRARRPRSCG